MGGDLNNYVVLGVAQEKGTCLKELVWAWQETYRKVEDIAFTRCRPARRGERACNMGCDAGPPGTRRSRARQSA